MRLCHRVWMLLAVALLTGLPLWAQDPMPLRPSTDLRAAEADTLGRPGDRTDTLQLPLPVWPEGFACLDENCLTGSCDRLCAFWAKVQERRAAYPVVEGDTPVVAPCDTLRILHVGDSHVRGRIFPRTTGDLLCRTMGHFLTYEDMGINGAFCTTFSRPDRVAAIAARHPDLLILSLGTNESHNRRYDPLLHYQQLDDLLRMLQERMPGVPVLLTTPPGSYDSFRQRRRRRTYAVNPRTEQAVRTIQRYAADHGMPVWDLYDIAGGARRACLNWQKAGLMRPDHVHYMPDGYRLQGELLCQALLKAYNAYVKDEGGAATCSLELQSDERHESQ